MIRPASMRAIARRKTAYHEAGHAVLGRVLTLVCDSATIKPDHDSAGHSLTHDPRACIYEWEKRGKVREPDAVWHARIIGFMAGAEAEAELLGTVPRGDGDDRYQIELMAEELETPAKRWDTKIEPRLRAMTRMLVHRHRALIERVAQALIDQTTLSREELDNLVGRSVDRGGMN
jgi:ATP-dependent Zn protease